jgi:hypothetical protein
MSHYGNHCPCGDHLMFASFQNEEIRKLWSIEISEANTAVINEYRRNLSQLRFVS